jgi:hypothetical protein
LSLLATGILNEFESKKRKFKEIAFKRLEVVECSRDEEFERLADELADFAETNLPPEAGPLSARSGQ